MVSGSTAATVMLLGRRAGALGRSAVFDISSWALQSWAVWSAPAQWRLPGLHLSELRHGLPEPALAEQARGLRRAQCTGFDLAEASSNEGAGVASRRVTGRDCGIGTAAATVSGFTTGCFSTCVSAGAAGSLAGDAPRIRSRRFRERYVALSAATLVGLSFDATCVSGPLARTFASPRLRHARPVPHAADVEMHEGRAGGRIEADAAALRPQAGLAQLLERHARNVEVHRLAEHVLADAGRRRSNAGAASRWSPASGRTEMMWIGVVARPNSR